MNPNTNSKVDTQAETKDQIKKYQSDKKEYDVVIIGAGVIGTFVARHMARKDMRIAVIEKEDDVCCGVSKAHTAIVHCGYSGKPGSVKAKMTVKANENFHNVCDDLDVQFRRCGSIITAKADKGMEKLQEKLDRGRENGVRDLVLLNREETLKIEPNISDEVIASVYAPTTGVADPWEYCVAAMENAMDNGVELYLRTKVLDMEYFSKSELEKHSEILIRTDNGEFRAKYVINCAGLYSDVINDMTEEPFFKVAPRKGEYIVLDKSAGSHINGFIFQAREEDAPKGVIISPTIHGNLMVGPSSEDIQDKSDASNTIEGLEHIKKISKLSIKNIPFEKMISYFAGIRPRPNWIKINEKGEVEGYEDKVKDFIITRGKNNSNLINVAGMKSPGFTCADEIGKYVYEMIYDELNDVGIEDKKDFKAKRRKRKRIDSMDERELNELILENPDYGEVVCKCNMITRGEILDVINRNSGATTVGGVKRRTGASMGKCHGSHCKTEIQKIIDTSIQSKSAENAENRDDSVMKEQNSHNEYQTVIIGGGIAGISIAINLIEKGIKSLAIVERDSRLGGILNQCIHHGFGVKYLKKNMTGPEYSNFFIKKLIELSEEKQVCLDILTDTEVTEVDDKNMIVKAISRDGIKKLKYKTIVMTTGCIERHIGQIFISGNRVNGIYTAGEAQRIVNMEGKSIGKKAVVIGSGDIGLIMTRRLIIEGTEVLAIVEKNDTVSGLARNRAECADAYDVPIEFNSRILKIFGKDRVEGLEYEKDGERIKIDCDAIVTSVGLEPEMTLLEEKVGDNTPLSNDSIFVLGNSDYVHDLVDDIAIEAEHMSENIIEYMKTGNRVDISREVASEYGEIKDYDIVCTVCPESCRIKYKGDLIFGNRCPNGRKYAISQRENPSRYLTTTVKVANSSQSGIRASIKTVKPVKLELVEETIGLMKEIEVKEASEWNRIKLKNGIIVEIICPLMV